MSPDLGLLPVALKTVAPTIIKAMSKQLSQSADYVKANLASTFERHLQLTETRCSKVRTIFSGEDYIPLSDIYVNLYIGNETSEYRDEDIYLDSNKLGNIVITGTGGAGKTMIMKHVANLFLQKPKGQIPLFIELRNLPEHKATDFYRTIFDSITRERDQEKYTIFLSGLRQGLFVLFLDGLDEVHPSSREQVFSCIQRIGLDFPTTKVIASTRPEIDTRPWSSLATYAVRGMNLDQARRLVSKIDFPQTLKSDFLSLMNDTFFERHKTFLRVPLLCSIMLLTYNEYKDIPSRITVFYDQAFETLLRRHDLQKEGYFSRPLKSQLASDRFRALFAAFCYRTLALNQLTFSDSTLRDHLERVAEETEISINVDDYAADLVSSVCVLIRDGRDLHFIHRSFQEYFAAIYITRYRGDDIFSVISRLQEDIVFNSSLLMAYDIEPKTIEREWVSPALKIITDYLKRFPKKARPYRFLQKTTFSIEITGNPPSYVRARSWSLDQNFRRWLMEIDKLYPDRISANETFAYGAGTEATELCNIKLDYSAWPSALKDVCDSGRYPADADELEAMTATLDQRWFVETCLNARLHSYIESLFSFEKEVTKRVKRREKISLLR